MTVPGPMDDIEKRVTASVTRHWKAFLIEGILLVILGFGAIAVPPLASIGVAIFLGWMFLISGIAGLFLTFSMRQVPGFWWALLSAVVAIVAGGILLWRPLEGTLSLTIVVGAYFLAEGVATILYALEHRKELTGRWGWVLLGGVMDLIISGVILAGLPGSALWAVGLLAGINLVFGGATLIGMALAARDGKLSADAPASSPKPGADPSKPA
ncbi:MAG: HdeD family acid-resistance protein [Bradyrhizobiaceae bacterium]|nr:MAG: HdeD family acid-resistance protein [Bradyrhizobiaceae bacterium]